MHRIAITNQVFGYASAVLIFVVMALLFVGILSVGDEPAILGLWLISLVYVLPFGAAFALVWVILSIVQCFKFEKVGTIGGITPKKASIVLGIFLSIAFLLLAAAIAMLIIDQIVEPVTNEEDIFTQIIGYIAAALPLACLGQAIFNSVYSHKLKKSL